jgi:hypothetical protein
MDATSQMSHFWNRQVIGSLKSQKRFSYLNHLALLLALTLPVTHIMMHEHEHKIVTDELTKLQLFICLLAYYFNCGFNLVFKWFSLTIAPWAEVLHLATAVLLVLMMIPLQ